MKFNKHVYKLVQGVSVKNGLMIWKEWAHAQTPNIWQFFFVCFHCILRTANQCHSQLLNWPINYNNHNNIMSTSTNGQYKPYRRLLNSRNTWTINMECLCDCIINLRINKSFRIRSKRNPREILRLPWILRPCNYGPSERNHRNCALCLWMDYIRQLVVPKTDQVVSK